MQSGSSRAPVSHISQAYPDRVEVRDRDIGVSLWGECEAQDGMHLGARGFVHAELIEPETGVALELEHGAVRELVLTHLRRRAAPLLRFRTRDHVEVRGSPCRCGRTSPPRNQYKSNLVER